MKYFREIIIVAFLLTIFLAINALCAAEKRTALVIGNSAYESGPLSNPVNDAGDMANALQKLGFEVILKKNIRHREMDEAIEDFGNRLKRGGVGLFYFAGHGIQINGVNYLVPIGVKIQKESDAKYEAIDANRILDEMGNANNGLNIIILDACRDNPFARSFRSASRGLAIISSAPEGSFISYATGPGQVAMDGEKRNSPYTAALLKHMSTPGMPIEQVFKNVRIDLSNLKQTPWELSSLKGEFYFSAGAQKSSAPQPETPLANNAPTSQDTTLSPEKKEYPDRPAVADAAKAPDITGMWYPTHSSGRAYIGSDGNVTYKGYILFNVGGKWKCIDPVKRIYAITWNHGFTDTMTLSPDGQKLEGLNNVGDPVSFVRTKP